MYNPEQYWNDRAMSYNIQMHQNLDERNNIYRIYRKYKPKSILEVGPGSGRIFNTLIEAGLLNKNYKSVDISDRMRNRMYVFTGHLPDKWDGRTLPYTDRKFDMVVSFNVLLHVPPEEIENHIRELIRVCDKWLLIGTYTGQKTALHCFAHDYINLFSRFDNVRILEVTEYDNDRKHYLLEKEKEE